VLVLRVLRLLRLDEERCWRVGVGCVEPVMLKMEGGSEGSRMPLDVVDEPLLLTEAECCARRVESSRVRRLT